MPPSDTQIAFVELTDDTDENRDIVEIVETRSQAPRSHDRDLDELLEEVGYTPRGDQAD